MTALETIDGSNWREFVAAPTAVLLIGKSDCAACRAWGEEVSGFVADLPDAYSAARFGKMLLDTKGLTDFKRENPWLAELTQLPHTVIYRAGERKKWFDGGGLDRLKSRLDRLV